MAIMKQITDKISSWTRSYEPVVQNVYMMAQSTELTVHDKQNRELV